MIRNSSPCMRRASVDVSCAPLEACLVTHALAACKCAAINKADYAVAYLLQNLVVLPGALKPAAAHLRSMLQLHVDAG